MVGVFCFSEASVFVDRDLCDKIHLFPDEESARNWQVDVLVEAGELTDHGDDIYSLRDAPEETYNGREDALEKWQNCCTALEFFHAYEVTDHRAVTNGAEAQ